MNPLGNGVPAPQVVRCALYTRKSTEEGLDQEFNSLDAQREAAQAYVLVSGKPLDEPVAWYGPIVMNTQEQLQQAFQELREGTFLKA
jgi:redox-sensitive bicupin YhaK (pirin superfamily)